LIGALLEGNGKLFRDKAKVIEEDPIRSSSFHSNKVIPCSGEEGLRH
jgi:hypothetical protein